MRYTREEIAKMIDHTALKPFIGEPEIKKLCDEATEHGFFSVCINPWLVSFAKKCLEGSEVKVCTVVGFPLGVNLPGAKIEEAGLAVIDGADEIDMVMNYGALKQGKTDIVASEIEGVVNIAEARVVKVIIETCYLSDEEKVLACNIAKDAGAQFVKTSTGFGTGGATISDIELMRKTVGPDIGVKASGGIKSGEDAITMIEAGASRIGASAGIEILAGLG